MKKRKGGASRSRPRFWPVGRSQPSPPARFPLLAPAPAPRPRARTAAPQRRGTPAAFGRRVARMRRLGRALVGHQVRPATLTFAPAARRTRPLALSLSLSPARSRSRAAARHCRRRSELFFLAAPASSLPSATTSDSASPFASRAHAQSRSVSLACPVELTRVSRSSDNLLAHAVLPLLSANAYVLECVSFALASRIISR